jgi:hypothetical protein
MSYIVETTTKEDFLENNTKSKRNIFSVTLNQFEYRKLLCVQKIHTINDNFT